MADVFLSYASEDRAFARRVAETLTGMGWSVWWDRKIPPGLTYVEVIERELGGCRAVVVVWSTRSVGSQWVRTEANEALDRRILIPVRMDETKLPLEFRHLQTADLTGWSGNTEHPEFVQVVDRLQQLTEGTRPSVPLWPAAEPHATQPSSSDDPLRSDPDTTARDAMGLLAIHPPPPRMRTRFLIMAAVLAMAVVSYSIYHTFGRASSSSDTHPSGTTTSVAPTVTQLPTTSTTPPPLTPQATKTDHPEPEKQSGTAKKPFDPDAGTRSPATSSTPQSSGTGSALVPPRRNSGRGAPNPGSTAGQPLQDGAKPPASPSRDDGVPRNIPLQPVFFARNSASLTTEARRALDRNAFVLKQYPSWMITIEGHANDTGNAEQDLALGERRAVAARNYLVGAGISTNRLRTVSYGNEFPFDKADAEQNRRAHLVLTAR